MAAGLEGGAIEVVESLERAVHAACAQLRFSEGLRRRWAEARAEAAVQEAAHFSVWRGTPVPASKIRALTFGGDFVSDEGEAENLGAPLAEALGVWRATWEALSELPPLNSPRQSSLARTATRGLQVPHPQMLATINKNASSFLVAAGLKNLGDVGRPEDAAALQGVLRASSRLGSSDAITHLAEIWEMFATRRVFRVASEATGLVYVKTLLAQIGAEPTGVAVLSKRLADESGGDRRKARAEETGEWQTRFREMVLEGAREGEALALHVQAGVTKN